MRDESALRKDFNIEGSMLQEMFANIDQADGAGRFDPAKFASEPDPAAAAKAALDAYKEELKDQLYQTYLMTMPERSFRKQFLHAEKITVLVRIFFVTSKHLLQLMLISFLN